MLVIGCNTVDPSQCWPNTSGGLGGGDPIPIGAGVGASSGDFISPPRGPLDYGGAPNPCIEPQSSCNEKCLADYEAAALECGKVGDAMQRKICQDGAYAAYKSCGANCQQDNGADSKECTDKYVNCMNNAPTSCLKRSGGKTVCRQCRDRCNAGDSPSPTCVKCLF
jgi:hypothetical protein